MIEVWLLVVSLGYPSYGYATVPGISSEPECRRLAAAIDAGTERTSDRQKYPFWTCTSYTTKTQEIK